ncbi:zinc finger protein STAMENLESS 1-like [Raphanus sativus]|uniref:Zinc finger protein STAMENLESS 1-like n=1 Tax=Raphanus sativus TaxID=3726 RepID=A0A6J0L1N8_RAPSA|nr:zinc finger protein STAMENLESS 1-like [Raphanus sativus]
MAMENNNSGLWSTREVMSENPSLGSGAVPTGDGFMQRYTSEHNKIYTCRFCNKLFSVAQSLGGHMNAHKTELQWERKRKEMEKEFPLQSVLSKYSQGALSDVNNLGITPESFKRICTGLYPSFNSGLMDMNMTVGPRMAPTGVLSWNTYINGSFSGGLAPVPSYNNYPPMLPRNVPPFPPHRTTNLPSYLYPQENVLNEEDVILNLGNGNTVKIDDDGEDAVDPPEEGTSKSWGADLSL